MHVAATCRFDALLGYFLDAIATRLAGTGRQAELLPMEVLQAMDAGILAQLLTKTVQRVPGGTYAPPGVMDVTSNPDGTALSFCFFTSSVAAHTSITSATVDVGGFKWTLQVHAPDGTNLAGAKLQGGCRDVGRLRS